MKFRNVYTEWQYEARVNGANFWIHAADEVDATMRSWRQENTGRVRRRDVETITTTWNEYVIK